MKTLALSEAEIPAHLRRFFRPRHVYKPKDDAGIPWRLAFALQADGWWLRSEITWCKRAPMPESVTDRPTSATEKVFLLAKSASYFYDTEAVKENSDYPELAGKPQRLSYHDETAMRNDGDRVVIRTAGRNMRNFWLLGPDPFPEAHFATYPKKLVEPCVRAGTSEKGACAECGAPWERVVDDRPYPSELANARKAHGGIGNNLGGQRHQDWLDANPRRTTGWRRTCTCSTEKTRPCLVLDSFAGSGTTGLVARRLGRSFLGIELSEKYAKMARRRIRGDMPLFNTEKAST